MTRIHSEPGADFPQQGICTNTTLPSEQRKELWLSSVMPGIARADIMSRPGKMTLTDHNRNFDGLWQYSDLDFLRYNLLKVTSHTLNMTATSPATMITCQLEGVVELRKGKQKTLLTPGSWVITRGTDCLEKVHRTDSEQIILFIDLDRLDLEGMEAMRAFAAKRGIQRLLYEFIYDTFPLLPLHEPVAKDIADTTLCLLRHAITESEQTPKAHPATNKRVNAECIKRFIEQHLDDPLLCIEHIARHFFCSTRTLHRTFSTTSNESIANYLWRRRIECCARELNTERGSISNLAYRYGFSSATHFNRLFKKYYKMTPTQFIKSLSA